jgi:DNA-binding NtrC family response regulator
LPEISLVSVPDDSESVGWAVARVVSQRNHEGTGQLAVAGNVRELENVVERSVILTEGKTWRVPLSELVEERQNAGEPYARTSGTRTHPSRVAGRHRLGLWTYRSGPSIGAEAEHFCS